MDTHGSNIHRTYRYLPSFIHLQGRWIEDHGVIHNMMFNTETLWKYSFKTTQNKTEWWDNGVLPLWITAQRQVSPETLG